MNVAVLHDEVERLKAELAQTQEALAQSEEARRRLESIVSDFQRVYGSGLSTVTFGSNTDTRGALYKGSTTSSGKVGSEA